MTKNLSSNGRALVDRRRSYYDFGLARDCWQRVSRQLYTCDETRTRYSGLRFYLSIVILRTGSRYLRALNYIRGTWSHLERMVAPARRFSFQYSTICPELIVITLAKLLAEKSF